MLMSRWVLDESKSLSTAEAARLLRAAKRRAAQRPAPRAAQSDYLLVHLALAAGLRVGEIARLRCGDIFIRDGTSSLIVRRGKGGRPRSVAFNGALRPHLLRYLNWKYAQSEPVSSDAPLLLSGSTGEALTIRAIQKAFKRCVQHAGLSSHSSMHSLRHTYACRLYRASGWNLRPVQKQLGHVSIATTHVYADVMQPDARRALARPYK